MVCVNLVMSYFIKNKKKITKLKIWISHNPIDLVKFNNFLKIIFKKR